MERFVNHDHHMVEPDFKIDTMHPNDEPFWLIASPYDPDGPDVFLLDRGGVQELIRQLQEALAKYNEKFPSQPNETPQDQMRPGGPK